MRSSRCRSGITLIELVVVVAILGILAGLVLPAVQAARESSRRMSCQNNLKNIGLALLNYHGSHRVFPPGFTGENPDPTDGKGWAWGTLLLPYLEQRPLYDALSPNRRSLWQALNDPQRRTALATRVPVYFCPSDGAAKLSHPYRTLRGFALPASTRHPPPVSSITIQVGTSNYVASFGEAWKANSMFWSLDELRGTGVYGCNTHVRLADVTDGTSNTFAAGERAWSAQAAVWSGVEAWDECTSWGIPMVLGTAYYRLNEAPQTYHLSCRGGGSAGFGSRHRRGAHFVMCDGAVRFVDETIDFRNARGYRITNVGSELGVYQRLARKNDREPVGGF